MSFARAFVNLTHVAYGATLVRVDQIVTVHEADEYGRVQVEIATGRKMPVEEPYPVVCALMQKALEP
jgi:hypothetical protein